MDKMPIDNNYILDYRKKLLEWKIILQQANPEAVEILERVILPAVLKHLGLASDPYLRMPEDIKILQLDVLNGLLEKSKVKKLELFFNILASLIFSIHDPKGVNEMKNVSEEYKYSTITCIIKLFKALSLHLLSAVYVPSHYPKLGLVIYVCLQLAASEKLRSLRIAAMECIMTIAKVESENILVGVEIRRQIGQFLKTAFPGLMCKLKDIMLGDFKAGHTIIMMAVRTWGRLVALIMADEADNNGTCNKIEKNKNPETGQINWYRETDGKLNEIVTLISTLVENTNVNVRNELAKVSMLILKKCKRNLPESKNGLLQILIILSCDEHEKIATKCKDFLNHLSEMVDRKTLYNILDKMKLNLHNAIISLPRIFNGIDENKQLRTLNIIYGYILFCQEQKIFEVIDICMYAEHLLSHLILICQLEKPNFQLIEEQVQDFERKADLRSSWLKFSFQDDLIRNRFVDILHLLRDVNIIDPSTDYLVDVFMSDADNRRTATFMLNEMLNAVELNEVNEAIITSVLKIYLDHRHWNLPLVVGKDIYGDYHSLGEIQENILQICMQTEGIGKFALSLKEVFENRFLLSTIFEILEKAGSDNPLIRQAGLQAINNIATACGCASVTQLINKEPDFFSYHVVRKINRLECNESVLNVLCAVMRLSTIDVLPSLAEIMECIIMQSCDQFQEHLATAYLKVFKVFVQCMHSWLSIEIKIEPIKSKAEKEREMQEFMVSGIKEDNTDFSDEAVMGSKSAEEMFREDLEKDLENAKNQEDETEEDVQEFNKPEPPLHVKITVSILKRSLNFLPSKNKDRKILVLEILRNGLEIIRDWENELLPIVHLIWSPLIPRFSENTEHLIVNLSFQLLVVLARLSKDFIRSRTAKDVLPSLTKILSNLSKESYLKDKGSSYRYTQSFRLQTTVLKHLAEVVINLDLADSHLDLAIQSAIPYLSDKQPMLLQDLCRKFFTTLIAYDEKFMKQKIVEIRRKYCSEDDERNEYRKNLTVLSDLALVTA